MSEITTPRQDTVADLAKPYLDGKKAFLDLNFADPKDRKVALYCLKQKTSFLKQLTKDKPSHLILLAAWIRQDYSNYIHVYRNNLSTPVLLELYLYNKFKKTNAEDSGILLMQSLKKQLLICYRYSTKKGETISYFDSMLGVPTLLTVTANLKIKLVDSERLINALDYDISILDLPLAYDRINATVNRVIRSTLLDYITKEGLSYYQLPQYYSEFNAAISKALNEAFAVMGLEAVEVNILDIAIPNNTNEIFEKQFFAISEAKSVKKYEYEIEGLALDLYEKKAEIHNKYPEFPVTLTEAEKDFALNRYLNRNGIDTSLSAEIRKKKLDDFDDQTNGTLTKTKMVKPKEPEAPPASNFKKGYFLALFLFLLASCLVCIGSVPGGLIAIGITVLIFGGIAIAKYPAFLTSENSPEQQEYQKQMEEYRREYENYTSNNNENNDNN